MIDVYSSLYPKFFKFYNDQVFFAVSYGSIIKRSSNKKIKLPLWKKLGFQSLSYTGLTGPSDWNDLPNNFISAEVDLGLLQPSRWSAL